MADFVGPDASMPILRSRVHGEQADRFQLLGDGTILKGDGSGSLSVDRVYVNAKAAPYSAKGDARQVTVSVSSGSKALTGAGFTPSDHGKTIAIAGAGAAGATLVTTVTYNSATSLTLATVASATVASVSAALGTDDTAALQAAINAAFSAQTIFLGKPDGPIGFCYLVTAPLTVTRPGLVFLGASSRGAQIWFAGSGALFENGADNGHAYDANDYDGNEGVRFEHVILKAVPAGTALSNGTGNYAPGTIAIRDWRGGDIQLEDVRIEGFATGFWGIQSDLNAWHNVTFIHNACGAYVGPRSDQLRLDGSTYFIFNDRAIDLDSCWGAVFNGTSFVDNGSASVNPIRVRSQYGRTAKDVVFNDCWFEHLLGPAVIEAFVEVGVGDTNQSVGVVFNNPLIFTGASGDSNHARYFVKTGKCSEIHFNQIRGLGVEGYGLIEALVYHVDAVAQPRMSARIARENFPGQTMIVLGVGAASPQMLTEHLGGSGYGIGDGSGNRSQFLFVPNGNFPQIIWSQANGTNVWVQQVGLGNSQLLFISKLTNGELHIQDHSGNDHLKFVDASAVGSASISLGHANGKVGFYQATGATKQTVSGSRGGNAALASLLTALAATGLITDSTSA